MKRFGRMVLVLTGLAGAACSDGAGPGDGGGNGGGDPTGNRIAFLSSGNVGSMREDGSNRVMLTHDEIGGYDWASGPVEWSPDGTHLVATLKRYSNGPTDNLFVMQADGTGGRTVASAFNCCLLGGSWSPDGQRLAYAKATSAHLGSSAIFTVRADGENEAQVTTGTPNNYTYTDLSPQWSPDGQEIAFVSDRPVEGAPDFETHAFIVRLDGSEERQLWPGKVNHLNWSPDGEHLAMVVGEGSFTDTDFFANIAVIKRDGSGFAQLSQQDNVDEGPLWSPDASRLAFTSNRDGNPEVYVMNADGSDVRRLTNDPAADYAGAWSPDGTHLAFQTNRDGNWEIYTVAVDGTGTTNLTRSPEQETSPAWK